MQRLASILEKNKILKNDSGKSYVRSTALLTLDDNKKIKNRKTKTQPQFLDRKNLKYIKKLEKTTPIKKLKWIIFSYSLLKLIKNQNY